MLPTRSNRDEPQRHRIAVFSFAHAPVEGGAEVAVREIAARTATLCSYTVFTHRFSPEHEADEKMQNLTVRRLGPGRTGTVAQSYGRRFVKLVYIWRAWRAAERAYRQEPFAVIWAVMAAYAGAAALLFKLNHPSVPLLLTLQEGDSERHILARVNVLYPLWRLLFRRANAISAISKSLADLARRHGAHKVIEVIPNGVDMQNAKEQKKRAKKDGETIVITTSRLVPKNGVDILVRAVALARQKVPLRLVIVGDGPERDRLVELANTLGVAANVAFVGQVDAGEVSRYLVRADIFARPSRSEGLGNSFLEAMAVGLPVIGTPVGGITDFLRDGETGLMAKTEDPADVARKLVVLATNPAVYAALARAGKQLVMQRYRWEQIAKRMEGMFVALARQRSVVIASGIFPPEIGGSATWTALMHRALPRRGTEVAVVTYGARQKTAGVYSVSRLLPKGLRHLVYLCTLSLVARRAHAIIAADPSFGSGFMALLASRIAGKPLVVRVTGDYAWEQGRQRFGVTEGIDEFQKKTYTGMVNLLRRCQAAVVSRAALVVAPSQYLRRLAIGWGAPEERTTLIYNAIDPLPSIGRSAARERLGIRGFFVVTSGRLVPWKGFDQLIGAVADLADRFESLTLTIVGDGPQREQLKEQAQTLGIGDRVTFTGTLSRERLGLYLAASDVFCLNSSYEGLSHQLIEVLCGFDVAVVAADAGGNRELGKRFGDRLTLTPVGDRAALARTLSHALIHRHPSPVGSRTCVPFSEEAVVTHWQHTIAALTKNR